MKKYTLLSAKQKSSLLEYCVTLNDSNFRTFAFTNLPYLKNPDFDHFTTGLPTFWDLDAVEVVATASTPEELYYSVPWLFV